MYIEQTGPCYKLEVMETYNGSTKDLEKCLVDWFENEKDWDSHFEKDHYTQLHFSVTSDEKNYKDWLGVAESVPGSTICATKKKEGYTVYYCCVPLQPWLEE